MASLLIFTSRCRHRIAPVYWSPSGWLNFINSQAQNAVTYSGEETGAGPAIRREPEGRQETADDPGTKAERTTTRASGTAVPVLSEDRTCVPDAAATG